MAESAVGLAVDKLVSLLTQEAKLLKGIHKEVADIKDELEIIRAFLKDADSKAEKEGITAGVEAWVKQVREVAYQIEDVIDEYILHVKQHCDQHGFSAYLHRMAFSVKNLKPRHEIVSKIQDIKASLHEIKIRSERFQFISSEQEASKGNARRAILHDPRLGSLFVEEEEIVGVESSKDELISYLVAGSSRRTVISMVGMGGIGKTTLAKKVFDNLRVKDHFQCRVWITVSQSYDPEKLLRVILKKFHEAGKERFPYSTATMEHSSLINELREYLREERYFVVFDDVWEIGFWEDVKHALLDNDKASRILITTRNGDVSDFCRRSSLVHLHQMKLLPPQQAWELFCKKAFKTEFGEKCPNNLEKLSVDIVEKCGGLPLAIVAIGGLLATKEKVALEWQKLLGSLGSVLASDPHLDSLKKILSLSYGDLPYQLKACFLYLGMFPEDFSINRRRLIQLWVANGFVRERQGSTLEETAKGYLTELIQRSLVQVYEVSFEGISRTCRVHDVVRYVILDKSEELSFSHVSRSCSTINGIARHLSISKRGRDGRNSSSSSKSHTSSIMHFNDGMEIPMPINDAVYAKCKLLTALDFEDCPISIIPKKLGNLLHLRYLSLRDTQVWKLPKAIGKLHNLESLDLRASLVDELPVEINKFPKMRHLLADCLNIRGSIGRLEFLQTLWKIRVDDHNGVRLIKELGMLKQLRKLGIENLGRKHGEDVCNILKEVTHLQSLFVGSTNDDDDILQVQSVSSLPLDLHTLQLWGHLERLPHWKSELHSLAKLELGWSRLMDDPTKALQTLPNLKHLTLTRGYNGKKMHFEGGGFPKLKWLDLVMLDELNMIVIDNGALPIVEAIRISTCLQLKEVPSGIQYLKDLKELYFIGMPAEFAERLSSNDEIAKHVHVAQKTKQFIVPRNFRIDYDDWAWS